MSRSISSILIFALLFLVGCTHQKPTVSHFSFKEELEGNKHTYQKDNQELDYSKYVIKEFHEDDMVKLSTIYFKLDEYKINDSMVPIVELNSKTIKENKMNVLLKGYCDEFGSSEYNMALGLKRAFAVKNLLIKNGVDGNRLKIRSYGEVASQCEENKKECWSKNRRVELKHIY
jgi:peptidoglycan-associated lipoprotein